jgi:hypothetical protein
MRRFVLGAVAAAALGAAFGGICDRLSHAGLLLKPTTSGGGGGGSGATLADHQVGTGAGNAATSATAPAMITSTSQWLIAGYRYCQGDTCAALPTTPVTPTSIVGTRGETCSVIAGTPNAVIGTANPTQGRNFTGMFACSGFTSTGADTITMTMPSDSSYLTIYTTVWDGSTGIDNACTANTNDPTSNNTGIPWSITSGTAGGVNRVPLAFFGVGQGGATLTTGILIDAVPTTFGPIGSATIRLPIQSSAGAYTIGGNITNGGPIADGYIWLATIVCVKP